MGKLILGNQYLMRVDNKTTSANSQTLTLSRKNVPSNNNSTLREKLLAIQSTQNDIGIQSYAAMDLGTAVGIAQIVKWLANSLPEISSQANDLEVLEALLESKKNYFDKELFSLQPKLRDGAIEKLSKAYFDNPVEIIQSFEILLRNFLVGSKKNVEGGMLEGDLRMIVTALCAALEGLYLIDDDRIRLDSSVVHGWQFNNEKSNIQDSNKKFSSANEESWYGKGDVSTLLTQLLEESIANDSIPINKGAQQHICNILVLNWKVPVDSAKIPETKRSIQYRLNIYQTILGTLKDKKGNLRNTDPLYLRTPNDQIPAGMKSRVFQLRAALLGAYEDEKALVQVKPAQYSSVVVETIESVLNESSEIPRVSWSKEATVKAAIHQQNELRFAEFKGWASGLHLLQEHESEACFKDLNQEQFDNLQFFENLFLSRTFQNEKQLNENIQHVLDVMNLDSQDIAKKLTQRNNEKGLLFFRYLNTLIEKQTTIARGTQSMLKNYLNEPNKNRLLAACKLIVNDDIRFPATARDLEFYTNPLLTSVPGQALILHHRLAPCFTNGGYSDIYNIKDRITNIAVNNFSPKLISGDNDNGFLLSGPTGTGKTFAAKALANQLAVPLFTLTPAMVIQKEDRVFVAYNNKEITISDFFHIVKNEMPSVLLIEDIEILSPPQESAASKILTASLLVELQNIRNSKTILIITTNYPPSGSINTAELDEQGYNLRAEQELHKYIDPRILRKGRVDFKIFSFHKPLNTQQGEALARHSLKPYIISGKVEKPENYIAIGQVVKDYTPAVIGSVFNEVANSVPGKVSIEDMLDRLKKETSRVKLRENTELVERLQNKISSLVETDQIKQLAGELDYSALAIAAKDIKPCGNKEGS